jgi:hypothetical protein
MPSLERPQLRNSGILPVLRKSREGTSSLKALGQSGCSKKEFFFSGLGAKKRGQKTIFFGRLPESWEKMALPNKLPQLPIRAKQLNIKYRTIRYILSNCR